MAERPDVFLFLSGFVTNFIVYIESINETKHGIDAMFCLINTFNIYCKISSKLRDKVPLYFELAPSLVKCHVLSKIL